MCSKLQAELGLEPAAILLNLTSPLATATGAEIDALRGSTDPALRFALERGLIERERINYLKQKIVAPQTTIERVESSLYDLDPAGASRPFSR